jgi:hypothetical protein
MYYSHDSRSTITFCAITKLLSTPHEINIDGLICGSGNKIWRKAMPLHKLPKYWYWRYSNSCQPNTLFETYLSFINVTSRISLGKYGVWSEASTAATIAKISTVELWGRCKAHWISMGEQKLRTTILDYRSWSRTWNDNSSSNSNGKLLWSRSTYILNQ